MVLVSISAMSACACLPWQISKWDLKFRSNFSRPKARNRFEFPGLFDIALCIYTESIFWWIQINPQAVGQTQHNTSPHLAAGGPETSPSGCECKRLLTTANCPLARASGHSVQESAKSSGSNFHSLSLPVFDCVETKAAFRNNAKQGSNPAVG